MQSGRHGVFAGLGEDEPSTLAKKQFPMGPSAALHKGRKTKALRSLSRVSSQKPLLGRKPAGPGLIISVAPCGFNATT